VLSALPPELAALTPEEIGDLLWDLEKDAYDERPVSFRTFVNDPAYLGVTFNSLGGFNPYWLGHLERIYPNAVYSPYYEMLVSLPIGSGKTLSALTSLAYEIYRMLCLKDPQDYYNEQPGTNIVFCFFSASKALALDVNWNKFYGLMSHSPWFKGHVVLPTEDSLKNKEGVELAKGVCVDLGSASLHALGKTVFGGILDEANFQRIKSEQAKNNYNTLLRRMESRFLTTGGSIPGKLWLVSSPNYSSDFLEARAKESKMGSKEISRSYFIEGATIYQINPKRIKYSGETFRVFVGDQNRDPEILPDEVSDNFGGGLVYEVPTEYRGSFGKDLINAIQDILGRSSASATNLFRSPTRIAKIATIPHRFSKLTIPLQFMDVNDKIVNYANMDYFKKPMYPNSYRFIHLDLSVSRDKLGIGCTFAVGSKKNIYQTPQEVKEFNDRFYYVDWCLSIKAIPGQQIPLYKIWDFLITISKLNYPIALITADQFQSVDTRQMLTLAGLNTGYTSVDGEKGRHAYLAYRDHVDREQILLPNHPLLKEEMLQVRDDGHEVDHLPQFSKDLLDGVVGSFWNCYSAKTLYRVLLEGETVEGEVGESVIGSVLKKGLNDGVNETIARQFGMGRYN